MNSRLRVVLFCFLDGQAQVLLKQTDVSVTRGQTKTAWIDCVGEGISDFKTAYIHWYRQIPPKAPERVLYIGSGLHPTELRYDLTIDYLTPRDSGIYYCTGKDKPYKKGTLFSEPQALNSAKNSDTSLFHPSDRMENLSHGLCSQQAETVRPFRSSVLSFTNQVLQSKTSSREAGICLTQKTEIALCLQVPELGQSAHAQYSVRYSSNAYGP
uniref:Ig-like domain-containing protein n=1 Tax=Bubo bubo TaxID=30461 RepID=A0A8C0FGS0_BUBBB